MSARTVPVQAIVVGERDREELGNISALAESIKAVGLLHPVVVTDSLTLVAGDRRLAAVKQLGWTQVPVTVVDLTTAADVLRAEADENTERKPLTPYEASRARQRRADVLAPVAAERKAHGSTAPGRPKATGLKPSTTPNAPANLAAALPAPAPRETRKVAAAGTGYSSSTLDKVDKIRTVAERRVVKRGKEEVPAPPPVVEVAKRALAEVKQTGAAVDRASKDVVAAIDTYIGKDATLARLELRKNFLSAKGRAREITKFKPEDVAEVLEGDIEWNDLRWLRKSLDDWFDAVQAARPQRLRVINGGSQ